MPLLRSPECAIEVDHEATAAAVENLTTMLILLKADNEPSLAAQTVKCKKGARSSFAANIQVRCCLSAARCLDCGPEAYAQLIQLKHRGAF